MSDLGEGVPTSVLSNHNETLKEERTKNGSLVNSMVQKNTGKDKDQLSDDRVPSASSSLLLHHKITFSISFDIGWHVQRKPKYLR